MEQPSSCGCAAGQRLCESLSLIVNLFLAKCTGTWSWPGPRVTPRAPACWGLGAGEPDIAPSTDTAITRQALPGPSVVAGSRLYDIILPAAGSTLETYRSIRARPGPGAGPEILQAALLTQDPGRDQRVEDQGAALQLCY